MQEARSRIVPVAIIASLVIACTSPTETRPPSTPGHGGVAGRDGDHGPDDGSDAPPLVEGPVAPGGNPRIRSFDEAKKALLHIYEAAPARSDLYCGCPFLPEPGRGLRVDLASCGYTPAKDAARAGRIEWEHADPAAAFGRSFVEWREGTDRCVDGKGKRYKGRKCARTSAEFARMEGDLHNLFPVVGEVNGLRGDLPMGLGDTLHKERATFHFGGCGSAIESGVFMPRREVRGDLARAYKYMDAAYPGRGIVDDAHRAVFDRWDTEDPPDEWERDRERRIAERQGNSNRFISGFISGQAPAALQK
jgi:deoxyribonuclease-1